MSGNIVMSNGVTVTSTNVIVPKIASVTYPGNDTADDIVGGRYADVTSDYLLTGYIDDLRLTRGYARYTSNFTAPTTAFITK